MTTSIGVLGGRWRAAVSGHGGVTLADGDRIDWWVAADDRWHVPAEEPVRQHRLGGTPVLETRVRVPRGDVVQRIYAVADGGGITVMEFENDSPLPVAIALNSRSLLGVRPPSDVAPQGIELPPGSAVYPLGHRAVLQLGIAHDERGAGPLPAELPTATQVARGWTSQLDRASRLVLPDELRVERVVHERCELALTGLDDPGDDPAAFLLGAHELARLGAPVAPWAPELAGAAEAIARRCGRTGMGWDDDRALVAAGRMFFLDHDPRAVGDVEELRTQLGDRQERPPDLPRGIRSVSWVEDHLVQPLDAGQARLLPEGVPDAWRGVNFECYRVPAGAKHTVSLALRWHGEHLAVLWETSGPPGLVLQGGPLGPSWITSEPAGEGLLTGT